jgi:hypothetical protein
MACGARTVLPPFAVTLIKQEKIKWLTKSTIQPWKTRWAATALLLPLPPKTMTICLSISKSAPSMTPTSTLSTSLTRTVGGDDLQKVFAGRPSEDYYWRTHPNKDNEWKLVWTITFEDATYLVHPKVAEVKRTSERKIRPLQLVRCVNVKGREQIWPLKLDRPGKKRNECNASALMVAERMREEWLMLVYDDETKTYFARRPVSPITDPPKWTQRTFQQLRDLAFPEDRRINTLDHPVWRKLATGK